MKIQTLNNEQSEFEIDTNEVSSSDSCGEEQNDMSELEDDDNESIDSASRHSGEEQDNGEMSSDEVENGSQSSASEHNDVEMSDTEDNEENSESGNKNMTEEDIGNAGWADAISKVLRTNKPKKKKTLVLSRAKKINDPRYINDEPRSEGPGFEIDGETKEEADVKPNVKPPISSAKEKEIKRKRKEWENLCRVKPLVLERDRERALAKIATKGVVQLFNAVRTQQKTIETNLKAAGSLESRQEKVFRSVDKNSFLDILMGPTKSTVVSHGSKSQVNVKPSIKLEEEDTKAPLWNVLRDDFLVSGKLKDWDRAPTKDGEEDKDSGGGEESDSDSD